MEDSKHRGQSRHRFKAGSESMMSQLFEKSSERDAVQESSSFHQTTSRKILQLPVLPALCT